MTDKTDKPAAPAEPVTHVAPSPHVGDRSMTTRRMMTDVLIALALPTIAAAIVFRQHLLWQLLGCVGAAVATEALFAAARRKPWSITDGSAVVTGVILALSLPWSCPWYVTGIAAVVAVVLGKMIFGGLGQNIFNPAMVGRAFVMIGFVGAMGAKAYVNPDSTIDTLTHATPMTAWAGEKAISDSNCPTPQTLVTPAARWVWKPNIFSRPACASGDIDSVETHEAEGRE